MRHKTTDSQFKMRQSTAGRVKVRSCDGTRVLRNQWRPFGRQVVLSCQSAADGRPPLNGKAFGGQGGASSIGNDRNFSRLIRDDCDVVWGQGLSKGSRHSCRLAHRALP